MTRYYFPCGRNSDDLIKDPEGTELLTADEAKSQALKSARKLWADAIKSADLGADAVVVAGGSTARPLRSCLWQRCRDDRTNAPPLSIAARSPLCASP